MAVTQLARNVLQTGFTRVFLSLGVDTCKPELRFLDCARLGGIDQSEGEPTRIECPDPEVPDAFVVDSLIRGERGLATSEIVAGFSPKTKSMLMQLWRDGCPFDLQLRIGQCAPLNDPTNYIKTINLVGVYPTGYTIDQLGALEQSERQRVNETMAIAFVDFYEVVSSLTYTVASIAPSTPLVGITICDRKSCAGDLCGGGSGCDKIYAVGTDCKIYTSLDKAGSWTAQDMLDGCCTGTPVGVACICNQLVVVQDDGTIAYIERNELDFANQDAWLHKLAGINDVPLAMASYGNVAAVVTETGQIYLLTCDCGVSAELVYNGVAHGNTPLNAVSFSPNGKLVAAGDAGVTVSSKDYNLFAVSPAVPTSVALTAALAKTDGTWLVGDENGQMWCTDANGCSWVQTGAQCGAAASGPVTCLSMTNTRNLWAAVNGTPYRSVDGGANWVREPNNPADPGCRTVLKNLGTITCFAVCDYDHDFVVAIGTDSSNAGLILVGSD